MTIAIKMSIHSGIYASQGGGQTRTQYEWATGPRNLLKAAALLPLHANTATAGLGNIGHCGSWIEIDGQRFEIYDLPATMAESRLLLARVASGQHAADSRYVAGIMRAEDWGREGRPLPIYASCVERQAWQAAWDLAQADAAREEIVG